MPTPDTSDPPPPRAPRMPRIAAWALELAILALMLLGFRDATGSIPTSIARVFFPHPDVIEQAWVAQAFASDTTPLLPIVDEYYPSRYSPVHPWIVSRWIRAHGGDPAAFFSWSAFAFPLGVVLLHAWMACIRLPAPIRILVTWLWLFTPAAGDVQRFNMQEPTMLLLLALLLLAWFGGTLAARARSHRRPAVLAASLACWLLMGALGAALFAMRLTLLPLLAIPFASLLPFFRGARLAQFLVAFGGGAALVVLPAAAHVHAVSGTWGLLAHNFWLPKFGLSLDALTQPFRPVFHVPRPDGHAELVINLLVGFHTDLQLIGPVAGLLLLGGALVLLTRFAALPNADASPALSTGHYQLRCLSLTLFALIAAQSTYSFVYIRFLLFMFILLAATGVAGLWFLVRSHWERHPGRRLIPGVLAAAAVAVLLQLQALGTEFAKLAEIRRFMDRNGAWALPAVQAHARNAAPAASLDCPLFVLGESTIVLRMLLGLERSPWPIAQLTPLTETRVDYHVGMMPIITGHPPRTRMLGPAGWPWPAAESNLYNIERGSVRRDVLKDILARHHRCAVYYPTIAAEDMVALHETFATMRLSVRDISADPTWRLLLIEPAPSSP